MDEFWSRFHGLPGKIGEPGVHLSTRPDDGAPRIMFLKRHGTILISAPEELHPLLPRQLEKAEALFNLVHLDDLPGYKIDRIIGPAYLGCLSPEDFRHVDCRHELRLLAESDSAALDELRIACDATEWEHGGIDDDHVFLLTGVFRNGQLCAAGNGQKWTDELADIGYITHPGMRGRGYGTAAAAKATEEALARGFIPAWRTLLSNEPSVRTARSLGFAEYAVTLSVRLRVEV